MPEETKPVEREAFERFANDQKIIGQLIGLERQGDGYLAEAVNDAWEVWNPAWQASADAALERAAALMRTRAEDLGKQGYDEFHKAADAIGALKGSR